MRLIRSQGIAMYRLSLFALASIFAVPVGAVLSVFNARKTQRALNFLHNRSSLLRCTPGALHAGDGHLSTASSGFSSDARYIWLSESFPGSRDNRYIGYPLFTGAGYADPVGMTIEKCANYCDSQPEPYRFMGITYGFQCCKSTAKDSEWTLLIHSACDNFFEYIYESDEPCNTPCPGNPSEVGGCGGIEDGHPTASTYQNVYFSFPTTVPSVGLWNGLGCYKSVHIQLS
jgi:hypothetical protein